MSYLMSNYDMKNVYGYSYGPSMQGNQNAYPTKDLYIQQQMSDYNNSINMQQNAYQTSQMYASPQANVKNSASIAGTVGGLLGLKVGVTAGLIKKPYDKNGNLNSKMAQKVYEKYTKNLSSDEKIIHEQTEKVLKKIGTIKTPEGLKKLLDNNQAIKDNIVDTIGNEGLIENVSKKNLKKTKSSIKQYLEKSKSIRMQDVQNRVEEMWDPKKKKFISEDKTDSIYKAFKKAKRQVKLKNIGIFAAIGTVVGAVVGIGIQKLVNSKKNNNKSQYI